MIEQQSRPRGVEGVAGGAVRRYTDAVGDRRRGADAAPGRKAKRATATIAGRLAAACFAAPATSSRLAATRLAMMSRASECAFVTIAASSRAFAVVRSIPRFTDSAWFATMSFGLVPSKTLRNATGA